MPSRSSFERLAWFVQPGYVAAEVLIGVGLGVAYSFRDDTISALGTGFPGVELEGYSSTPWAMNVAFIGFGALQAVGAWHLLRDRLTRQHQLVGGLWAVAGSFSILVGFFPVDSYPVIHTLVALPVFVAQPLAIVIHARLLKPSRVRSVGMTLGAVSIAGAVSFGLLLNSDEWGGFAERAAIWPAKAWLAMAALGVVSHALRQPDSPSKDSAPDALH